MIKNKLLSRYCYDCDGKFITSYNIMINMFCGIEIYQRYALGYQHYHSHFVFDFTNKKAKFISQGITRDFRKSNKMVSEDMENMDIGRNLMSPHILDEFKLSDDDINKLKSEFFNLTDYKSVDNNYFRGIEILNHFIISSKEKDIEIINHYPKNWKKLGELIKNILGFDLLNIDLKYLITELHYNILNDGVYTKSGDKLKLTKINYHISSNIKPHNPINITITSSDKYFSDILKLFEKYSVYKWYHEDFLSNIKNKKDSFLEFKGNSWFLELIFNDKVLNLRGDNAFPDDYKKLAQEIIDLTKKDLLKIDEI